MSIIISGRVLPTSLSLSSTALVYTTFDTSGTWNNASADPTYSNGDLTALLPGGTPTAAGSVRSLAGFNSGLKYAELTMVSKGGQYWPIVGIVPSTFTTSTSVGTGGSYAWWGAGAPVPPNLYGQLSGNYGTGAWSAADVIGILVNRDTNTLTFYRNGVSQGVATSSLPAGTYHIWANAAGGGFPATVTANFGTTPFAYPVAGATGILA